MASTNPKKPNKCLKLHSLTTIALQASPSSLLDLPTEVIIEIMKRVAKGSYLSFVNAKATCITMRNLGQEDCVLKEVSFREVPLFVDDAFPYIERIMNIALAAGNVRALFRLGVTHCLCIGGTYAYGCQLINIAATKRLRLAIYILSLLLIAHSGHDNPNFESLAVKAWAKIYDEVTIARIRRRVQVWFPWLSQRLFEGNVFRVKSYTSCGSHPPTDRMPYCCTRCHLDIELQWFVESIGGNYSLH